MYPDRMYSDESSAREEAMQDGHNRRARQAGRMVNRFLPGPAMVGVAVVLCAGFLMAQAPTPPPRRRSQKRTPPRT